MDDYKISFIHYRVNEKGESVATGVAECSSKDAFCYRIGRDISRGRAFKALEVVSA